MPLQEPKTGLGKGGGGAQDMSLVTSWENWCVNFSFFFLTGAQAILWPWCPVILKAAGLTAFSSGVALSFITISSIVGVRLSLWAVTKTRNGAVRRLLLLGMFSCSVFFGISSVLILPSADDNYFCSTKSINSIGLIVSKLQLETKLPSKFTEPKEISDKNIINESIFVAKKKLYKNQTSKLSSGETVATSFPSSVVKGTSKQTVFIRKINLTQTNANVNGPVTEVFYINGNNSLRQTTSQELNTNFDETAAAAKDKLSTSPQVTVTMKNENVNGTSVHADKTYFPLFFSISSPTTSPEVRRNRPSLTEEPSKTIYLSPRPRYPNRNKPNAPSYNYRSTKITTPPSDSIIHYTVPKIPQNKEPLWPSNYGHLYGDFIDNNIHEVSTSGINLWEDYASPTSEQNHPRMKEEPQFKLVKREIKNIYPPIVGNQLKDGEIKNNASNVNYKEATQVTSFGVGVAVILIIAMLMGGGVESVISKIWFCRKNGLCQDAEKLDDMEITISPIFQICVMGGHRYWSLISSTLWITLPTIFVGLLCQMGADIHNPLTVMGAFHGFAGLMTCFTLLFIPMPYGSLRRCRSRRPLSLYLDDEVIREGLRRVSFHLWVLANGLLGALPTFFTLWLLQESSATKGEVFVSQVISITALLFGEAAIYPTSSWLSRKINTQGVMIMSSSFLWLQCLLSYYLPSIWLRSGSLLLVGYSVTTMWTAIRNNAFLLGTARDQEQEAWASWISWKVGSAFGAVIWASFLEMEQIRSVQWLLLPSAIIGMIITTALICIALLTKTKDNSRRRIYHTLDLNNFSDDEDDEMTSPDIEKEDDWLVKRAKKEGLTL